MLDKLKIKLRPLDWVSLALAVTYVGVAVVMLASGSPTWWLGFVWIMLAVFLTVSALVPARRRWRVSNREDAVTEALNRLFTEGGTVTVTHND